MTEQTRPQWGDLPHGDEISALLDELRTLSHDEAEALAASWRVAGRAVEDSAWAAWRAARGAARTAAMGDALDVNATRDVARGAAWEATRALVVADLVGQYGLTRDHLDILTAPARVVPRLASIIDRALGAR